MYTSGWCVARISQIVAAPFLQTSQVTFGGIRICFLRSYPEFFSLGKRSLDEERTQAGDILGRGEVEDELSQCPDSSVIYTELPGTQQQLVVWK